jgi:hypothetical protein
MRHLVTQAGEVDFVGCEQLAQGSLNGQNNLHQMRCISRGKVAHFTGVGVPDHAAKAGKGFAFPSGDAHHAAPRTAP